MTLVAEHLAEAKALYDRHEDKSAFDLYEEIRKSGKRLTPAQSADVLYYTAQLLKRMGKRDLAEKRFRDLYHEGLDKSQRYNQAMALHELGKMAFEECRYTEAVKLLRQELGMWHSGMEHYFTFLSTNFVTQGDCFMALGNHTEAKMYYKHAYTFAQTDENLEAEGVALERQGDLLLQELRKKEASKILKQALACYKKAEAHEAVERIEEKITAMEINS